ncbi:unnamed protein product [Bursaphelenchus okinawaensis]|uniref:Lipid-binding serum glycoprotein C-terminal domain-containing protein n=1 Tax=Bursaphelenchus okinawaensis TaxID=465554 RepID=A0A811LWP4_9BILA|nr:unnamed protein product [Bursaphelenchus okinawaensis]CAG9128481.1 unnamed protein product [Bursaphelenchus okinawaensis]
MMRSFSGTQRTFLLVMLMCGFSAMVTAQSLANSFFTEPDTFPGFTTRVGPKALDLMAEYLKQRVNKFMKFGTVAYNLTVPLTPLVRFSLLSNGVSGFDGSNFQSGLKVTPNKELLWTGSNMKITINSIYRVTSSAGEVTGSVPVTFDRSTVELALQTAVNTDGHLKTDLQRCRVLLNDIHFEFAQSDADLIRNYMPFIHRAVRDQVDNLLCPTFHAELVPVISNRLLNTPMSAALFDHYFINYGLMGPLLYNHDGLELRHRGNVFGILRQGRTRLNDFRLPFRSAPLYSQPENKHMVSFQMSNYTLASLMFWMDQYRKFDYEISKTSVNDSNIAGYLRTECGPQDICAGTLFPALAAKFAKGVVNIKTHTVTFPHVRIENGKVKVIVDSRIDAFVAQPDKNRRFLTANMLAELVLSKVQFKDYTITGKLNIDSFKISDVVSLVDGIDANSIEFLINALNDLILNDEISKKLKDGIKLPIVFDFEQASSEVIFEADKMTIHADYCFEEGCKQVQQAAKVETSQDMDVNYYDAAG